MKYQEQEYASIYTEYTAQSQETYWQSYCKFKGADNVVYQYIMQEHPMVDTKSEYIGYQI
jgi:hypothetical protein